jgi:hypothetical protein
MSSSYADESGKFNGKINFVIKECEYKDRSEKEIFVCVCVCV